MWVAVLGPLEVRAPDDGRGDGRGDGGPPPDREVVVAGARLRALLCRLAADPDRAVPAGELVAAVWPGAAPAEPANALQSLVSRLRRLLGDPLRLRQDAAGYRLVLGRDELDASVFVDRQQRAQQRMRAGDLDGAHDDLEEALALWRGEPLVDAGDADYRPAYATRWHAARLAAVKAQADLALRLGQVDGILSPVEELAAGHPFDQSLVALELRLLVAAGRTPEALLRFERTRRTLRDELGSDPSAELQQLHLTLLREADDPPADGAHQVDAARSNLRARLTSFVGRDTDLRRVRAALAENRLTTIVGTGGAGKTRLAVEAATRWLGDGGTSAWLVELAPVTEAGNLAPAVLGALGLREAKLLDRSDRSDRPTQDSADRLLDVLRDATCLLVVDNCEHLVDAVARLVDRILAEAPGVRVLTTSREPLALTGEALCPLAPLAVPAASAARVDVLDVPAVRLWLDRARAARPDFVLDDRTLAPVVEIVRRLDGLPLAIELAAARLRVLPVTEIAARLSDRFRLLTGGNRTSLPRHRTLRAVVEWSWDLLTADERLLAERLAVFPAGADVASARAVCADERLDVAAVDELLLSLVDKSLLQSVEAGDQPGPVRFRMLETIREYGVERLAERGELEQTRLMHAHYFRDLVVALEPVLRSRDQLRALATLNVERENILSALRFLGDSGRGPEALHLALALVWYWMLLDASSEAVTWLTFVVQANRGRDDPDLLWARACRALARLTSSMSTAGGDVLASTGGWEAATDDIAALADEVAHAPAAPFPGLEALAPMVVSFANRPDLVAVVLQRARDTDEPWLWAARQSSMAGYAENEGDLVTMRTSTTAAYEAFAVLGDRWGLSSTLVDRARLSTLEGRTREAIADYEEAARHVIALGSAEDDLYIRLRLADLYARLGDLEQAKAQLGRLRSASPLAWGGAERELFAGASLASLEWRAGETDAALTRLQALRRQLDDQPDGSPMLGHVTAIVLGTVATVTLAVGGPGDPAADLARAYAAGVATGDMPIVSGVGRAVAALALFRGQPAAAASILGASAQLLGSADESDPEVRDLSDRVRAELGSDFEECYRAGRGLSRPDALARLDPALLVQAR